MATTFILGLMSGGCLFLLVYPYAIYPLVLGRLPKRPVMPGQVDLSVSLLFCAYNEMESIPEKIENLRALKRRQPDLQILVYDDASTDGTSEMLSSVSDLLTVLHGRGRTGKAAGMKRLVKDASGDILVFTDANVILAVDAIDRLLPYYADENVGGVCGTLRYVGETSVTAEVGSLYWRLDEELRSLESATGNVVGADGSIFSVRRSLYPEFPDTVLDDLTVSMSVIFGGRRLIKAADVIAYEKSVARRADEVRRKVRIGARAYHTHIHLRPRLRRMSFLDRFKYMSRKQIRWFGGLFAIFGAAAALVAIAIMSPSVAVLLVAAASIGLALCFRAKKGLPARLSEILLAMFATLLGVLLGMRGRTVPTWSPAKSR